MLESFNESLARKKLMNRKMWLQSAAMVLISSGLLMGCSASKSAEEMEETQVETNQEQIETSGTTEQEVLEETPTSEEVANDEKDDTTGTVDQWDEEIYNDEMETLLFFRWDGIVEGIPYQVVSRSIDEQGYATVVIDLNEIDRVMSEEGLERHEAIYEMVRQIVTLFPDREKEGHLFKGYRLQFAKLESALGAELVMSSEDYVRTDWSTFEGTLASGTEMAIYDLMNRE